MPRFATALPFLLLACGAPPPAGPEPRGTGLLGRSGELQGAAIVTAQHGAWRHRVARPAPTTEGGWAERAAAVDGRAMPPGSAAAPAAVAVTGSDDFHLGATRPAEPGGAAGGAQAPLRAGATDDNAAFADYLAYLAGARQDLGGQFVDLDVSGRVHLRVVDRNGAPAPGVSVRIVDESADRVVWQGTTYGDGRVPFYPAVAKADGATGGPYAVEVVAGAAPCRQPWSGTGDAEFRLPGPRPHGDPVRLDVAFAIDTTGSMQDEIDAIKATLLQVTAQLRDLGREFDLRYGAVLYRDVGDEYLTAQHPLTGDLTAFDAALRAVAANGGGDTPESLNQGLAAAVDTLDWRDGAAKVVFLIADAAPHLDYAGDVPYDRSLRAAVAKGIRVHTVAASGLDRAGSVVFRQIAQFTRGEFVFVEYGGDLAGSAAAHGVAKAGVGNNLDAILFARLRDEIARFGR